MIAVCGLPTGPFDDKLIDAAFKAYKNPDQRDDLAKKYSLHLTGPDKKVYKKIS